VNWNDILIRVHVRAEPPKVPVVEVFAKEGEVDILGMASVKDELLVAAWKRFRARAVAWNPETVPYDFLRFDLFGLSDIADHVVAAGDVTRPAYIYARSGGCPVPADNVPPPELGRPLDG